jgi:hypothetical protein
MLQGIPSRRGTIKSFKSFIGIPENDEIVFEPKEQTNELDILYLPPTIPNLKYVSPLLWNWVTNGKYVQVFSPAGELLTDPLPRVLQQPPPLPTTERPLQPHKLSPMMGQNPSKQARKPVQENNNENKYFFLNVKSLQLNKAQGPVICLVGVEDQKRCSSVIDVYKQGKNSVAFGEMHEGFLFEIPRHKQQIVLSIRVYSKHGIVTSPSNASLSSNTSKLGGLFKKRTATSSSNFTFSDFRGPRIPADPSALGMLLCDYTMTLPSAHPFGKLDMGYSLHSGKKELGKVYVCLSMMFDAPYSPVSEVPRGMHTNDDYLNFYLYTNGGLVK